MILRLRALPPDTALPQICGRDSLLTQLPAPVDSADPPPRSADRPHTESHSEAANRALPSPVHSHTPGRYRGTSSSRVARTQPHIRGLRVSPPWAHSHATPPDRPA